MSLLGTAENRFTRYVEALEQELEGNPAFRDFRDSVVEYLRKHSESVSVYTPEQLISEANSFEELLAMSDFLREKYGNEQAWWDYYHVKRKELASAPSYYGAEKYGVPVGSQTFHRHWGKGHQSAAIHRDIFPQKLSYGQAAGQEPLWSARGGKIPKSFLEPLPFEPRHAQKYVSFDIETTGLLRQLKNPKTGAQRGLFSAGWVSETGEGSWIQRTLPVRAEGKWTRQPGTRPFFGYEVEEILERGERTAREYPGEVRRVAGEKQLLKEFIEGLQKQPKERALLGYNVEGFDIPFTKAMAERHGMQKELGKALKGRAVIDVAEEAKGFLSQQLSGKYLGWQRSMFEEMGMSPKGWTLETVAQGLGYKAKQGELAHTPRTDAAMAAFVHETLADKTKAQKIWASGGEQRYLKALEEKGARLTPLSAVEEMTEVRAGKVFLKPQPILPPEKYESPLLSRLSAKYGKRVPAVAAGIPPAAPSKARRVARWGIKGLKYTGGAALLGAALPGEGISNFIGAGASIASWQVAASKGGGLAFKAVASGLAYASVKGVSNAFEGMSKGGMSEAVRHYQTDFGSPWQGPKVTGPLSIGMMAGAGLVLGAGAAVLAFSSIEEEEVSSSRERVHGQYIDPSIMEFRKKWIKAPGKRKELERMKDEAYKPLQPGDLEKWRLQQRGEKISKVDISGLLPVWEDVDTLLLQQPWYKPWRKDIAVRLTGIDAPEVEHPDDPLPWTRRKQSQPFGEESVERLKELIGDEELELYVASGEDKRSYKRYLGAVYREGSDVPVNIEAVQRGLAAALPWGESGTDILPRELLMREEEEAAYARRGMWREEYWQRYLDISAGAERRVTFTSFSDMSRLAANLHLAAAEELMSRRDIEYEPWMGRYVGGKLEVNYAGASTKTHNKLDALHYGSENSMGAWSMKAHSDFGSGAVKGAFKRTGFWFRHMWERARGFRKRGGLLTEKGQALVKKKGDMAFQKMKRMGCFDPPSAQKKVSSDMARADTVFGEEAMRADTVLGEEVVAQADTVFGEEAMRADTVLGEEVVAQADTVVGNLTGRETVRLKNPGWVFPEVPEPIVGEFDPYTKERLTHYLHREAIPSQGKDVGTLSATRAFSLEERQEIFLRAAEKKGLKFSAMPDLSEGSAAARIREALTEFKGEFASRWDPIRRIASEVFKKLPEEEAFQRLIKSKGFRKSIRESLEKGGKLLGEQGVTSFVKRYSAKYKGHKFEFLGKEFKGASEIESFFGGDRGMAEKYRQGMVEAETSALATLGGSRAPSLYGTAGSVGAKGVKDDVVVMEMFKEAKPLKIADPVTGQVGESISRQEGTALAEFFEEAHSKEIFHMDLHGENVLRVKGEGGKQEIAVIDWAMSNRMHDPRREAAVWKNDSFAWVSERRRKIQEVLMGETEEVTAAGDVIRGVTKADASTLSKHIDRSRIRLLMMDPDDRDFLLSDGRFGGDVIADAFYNDLFTNQIEMNEIKARTRAVLQASKELTEETAPEGVAIRAEGRRIAKESIVKKSYQAGYQGRAASKLREQEAKHPSVAVPHVSARNAGRRHNWNSNKGNL